MSTDRRVTIVTDLGYGDAGKGSIVDYLARAEDATVVVRFNGGSQAAHNVVTPDGRHHTFSQFGSATFLPGRRTHLSRFMLVNPLNLVTEARQLQVKGVADPQRSVTIDEGALIITPYQQAANRLRELSRGYNRHGSCGHGIGETMADMLDYPAEAIRAVDLANSAAVLRKLEFARAHKLDQMQEVIATVADHPEAAADLETLRDEALSQTVTEFYAAFARNVAIVGGEYLGQLLEKTPHIVFEGAQGVLLDEWRGFHPYTTWSTTTFANADLLLKEQGYTGSVNHLGLLRAYATRHGAGPFVTEDAELTAVLPDHHNVNNAWQQEFRVGHFDLVAARYALEVAGQTDSLAITCLDRWSELLDPKLCTHYLRDGRRVDRLHPGPFTDLEYQERLTKDLFQSQPVYEDLGSITAESYVDLLESHLGVRVDLMSSGVTAMDKYQRQLAAV